MLGPDLLQAWGRQNLDPKGLCLDYPSGPIGATEELLRRARRTLGVPRMNQTILLTIEVDWLREIRARTGLVEVNPG